MRTDNLTRVETPFTDDVVLSRVNGVVVTNVPRTVSLHSPMGFEYGYGGSGPADLALNILNAFVPPGTDGEPPYDCKAGSGLVSEFAMRWHQSFKWDFIANLNRDESYRIPGYFIAQWIAEKRSAL